MRQSLPPQLTGFTGTEIIHTGTFVPGRTGERERNFISICVIRHLFVEINFRSVISEFINFLFIKMSQVYSPHRVIGNVQMSGGFQLG